MDVINDFKSINRKLNRLEQKAEADKKNEPVPTPVGWPYGPVTPLVDGPMAQQPARGRDIEMLKEFNHTMKVIEHLQNLGKPPVNPMIPASHPGYVRD